MNDQTIQPDPQRSAFTDGLRILAAALDADPTLPLPYHGDASGGTTLSVFTQTREEFHAYVRLLDATPDIEQHPTTQYFDFTARGNVAGVAVRIYGRRDNVCDRVVVGKETIDKVEWQLPTLPTRKGLDRLLAAVEASPGTAAGQ